MHCGATCERRVSLLAMATVGALLLACGRASANAGTALLLSGCCHLFVGNTVLGLIEGTILRKAFGGTRASVPVMMLANLVSGFGGTFLAAFGSSELGRATVRTAPLYTAGGVLVALAVASYVLTVLIEWPFCHWAIRGRHPRARASLLASAVASGITYAGLALIYSPVIDTSILWKAHVDRSLVASMPDDATIYYVGRDGCLWTVDITGTDARKASDQELPYRDRGWSPYPTTDLTFRPRDDGSVDLCLGQAPYAGGDETAAGLPVLVAAITSRPPNPGPSRDPEHRAKDGSFAATSLGRALDYRPEAERDWAVYDGARSLKLSLQNSQTGGKASYSLETPFGVTWPAMCAWALPGDRVVYELGPQIVLFDIPTRRVGHIVDGRDPVVIMKTSAPAPQ